MTRRWGSRASFLSFFLRFLFLFWLLSFPSPSSPALSTLESESTFLVLFRSVPSLSASCSSCDSVLDLLVPAQGDFCTLVAVVGFESVLSCSSLSSSHLTLFLRFLVLVLVSTRSLSSVSTIFAKADLRYSPCWLCSSELEEDSLVVLFRFRAGLAASWFAESTSDSLCERFLLLFGLLWSADCSVWSGASPFSCSFFALFPLLNDCNTKPASKNLHNFKTLSAVQVSLSVCKFSLHYLYKISCLVMRIWPSEKNRKVRGNLREYYTEESVNYAEI